MIYTMNAEKFVIQVYKICAEDCQMSFQALLCFLNSKHMTMENQDIYIY